MNKRHINFYCNLSLLFFCNINEHNCSLYHHYCKSCQRMTQLVLLNAKWAIVAISWRAKVTFNEMMMMPRCTRPTRLIGSLNNINSLKQQSAGRGGTTRSCRVQIFTCCSTGSRHQYIVIWSMRVTLSNFQCFTKPITEFMDD